MDIEKNERTRNPKFTWTPKNMVQKYLPDKVCIQALASFDTQYSHSNKRVVGTEEKDGGQSVS